MDERLWDGRSDKIVDRFMRHNVRLLSLFCIFIYVFLVVSQLFPTIRTSLPGGNLPEFIFLTLPSVILMLYYTLKGRQEPGDGC